jgi:hypothetical protein
LRQKLQEAFFLPVVVPRFPAAVGVDEKSFPEAMSVPSTLSISSAPD